MFFKTLLCKNIFHYLDILSSTPSFQIWSRGQFCTTTYLNISLKLIPKLREVSRSLLFHFVQKPIYDLSKIWVKQPHLHSGPTWWFVQQPYFCLLFSPRFFSLLVVLHAKLLSPGACNHWHIFGSWNNAIHILSRFEVLQNLHQQVCAFHQLTSPTSCASKETLIWKNWPLQEMPRCPWHFVKHLECMVRFGMDFS